MAEIATSAGTVTVRDSFGGKAAWTVSNAIQALLSILGERQYLEEPEKGYDQYVAICRNAITAWPFEGKPSDLAAYEKLESQIIFPLFADIFGYVLPFFTSGEKKPTESTPS